MDDALQHLTRHRPRQCVYLQLLRAKSLKGSEESMSQSTKTAPTSSKTAPISCKTALNSSDVPASEDKEANIEQSFADETLTVEEEESSANDQTVMLDEALYSQTFECPGTLDTTFLLMDGDTISSLSSSSTSSESLVTSTCAVSDVENNEDIAESFNTASSLNEEIGERCSTPTGPLNYDVFNFTKPVDMERVHS